MKFLVIFALIIGITPISSNEKVVPAGLPEDFGAIGRACGTLWGGMWDEWHANGGGVLTSLQATRGQVASDKKSKLSRIIRRIWDAQKERNIGRYRSELWSWPISQSDHLRLMESSYPVLESEISNPDCRALVWLQSRILRDIYIEDAGKHRKLPEAPANMEWKSPWMQQWIEYWIFVNIK